MSNRPAFIVCLVGLCALAAGSVTALGQVVVPDPVQPTGLGGEGTFVLDPANPSYAGPRLDPFIAYHYGGPRDLSQADAAQSVLSGASLLDQAAPRDGDSTIALGGPGVVIEGTGIARVPDSERLTSLTILRLDQ